MKQRRMKKRLKAMRDLVLEQMENEQVKQVEMRNTLLMLEGDVFKETEIRRSLEESMKHSDMLSTSLEEYNKLIAAKWKVSPDTLAVVFGNLAGILLILNFEKLDIVRSKAMSFVLKGKL